jgi:hypothetical protein
MVGDSIQARLKVLLASVRMNRQFAEKETK